MAFGRPDREKVHVSKCLIVSILSCNWFTVF